MSSLAAAQFTLAEECLNKAKDLNGLLLLYTAASNANGIRQLAELAGTRETTALFPMSPLVTARVTARLQSCPLLLTPTGPFPVGRCVPPFPTSTSIPRRRLPQPSRERITSLSR